MPSGSTGDETAGDPPNSRVLAEPVLVVRRKPHKGRRPEYGVFDADGRQVAQGVYVSDDEIGPLMRSRGLRHWTAAALRIVDAQGDTVFLVVFPGWRGRAVLLISDGEGLDVGEAVKTKGFLRMTYELRHGKHRIGAIQVMDRRQRKVVITDETGVEVAVVRTEAGETPSAVDDAGEAYSLQVHAPLKEPLRSLVVASAIALQAAIGSETSVGETDVLKLSLIPRSLDPLRRRSDRHPT